MLERERLELLFPDQSLYLGLVEEGREWCFNDVLQNSSVLRWLIRANDRRKTARPGKGWLGGRQSAVLPASYPYNEEGSVEYSLRA